MGQGDGRIAKASAVIELTPMASAGCPRRRSGGMRRAQRASVSQRPARRPLQGPANASRWCHDDDARAACEIAERMSRATGARSRIGTQRD